MNYAMITDCSLCNLQSNLSYEGIKANYSEWMKYGFHPQNGMVGIIVHADGKPLLHIFDGKTDHYVCIDPSGMVEISKKRYEDSVSDNRNRGISFYQRLAIDYLERETTHLKLKKAELNQADNIESLKYCCAYRDELIRSLECDSCSRNMYDRIQLYADEFKLCGMEDWSLHKTLQTLCRLSLSVSKSCGWQADKTNEEFKMRIAVTLGLLIQSYRIAMGALCYDDFDNMFQDAYDFYLNNF